MIVENDTVRAHGGLRVHRIERVSVGTISYRGSRRRGPGSVDVIRTISLGCNPDRPGRASSEYVIGEGARTDWRGEAVEVCPTCWPEGLPD